MSFRMGRIIRLLFWLLVILIGILFIHFRASSLPLGLGNREGFFFLYQKTGSDSAQEFLLVIDRQGTTEQFPLSSLDKAYLEQIFTRSSPLEKAGGYMIVAGGAIGASGEIAGLIYPPLYPLIRLGTLATGAIFAGAGGLLTWLFDDLSPQYYPVRLQFLYQNNHYRSFQRQLTDTSLFFVLTSSLELDNITLEGYLIMYGQYGHRNIGRLRYSLVRVKEGSWTEIKLQDNALYVDGQRQRYPFVLIEPEGRP